MVTLRRHRRLLFVLAAGIVAHGVLAVLWPRSGGAPNELLDTWLYDALLLGAAAAVLTARPLQSLRRRLPWLILGVAALLWALGDVYWTVAIRHLDPEPFPTLADAAWLAFYPCAYVALFLLARRDLRRLDTVMWLDSAVVGAGTAAVTSAAVLPHLDVTAGNVAAVMVNAAYPLGDLTLLAVVAGIIALFGWRPPPMWWALAGGLAVFAAADTLYLVEVASDAYVEGTALDTMWPLGLFLLAVAGSSHPRVASAPAPRRPLIAMMVPGTFMASSVALLVLDHFDRLPLVAVVLAGVTLVASLGRFGVGFREALAAAEGPHDEPAADTTGAGDRRFFFERLLEARRACSSGTLALLVVDLDRFRDINESLGHRVGDGVLRAIGPRLVSALRREDVFARLGGDEFAVVVQGPVDGEAAVEVAGRIRAAVAEPFEIDGVTLRIEASVGIALLPEHGSDGETLLRRAEVAMYEAKRTQAGTALYASGRDEGKRARLQRIEELHHAVTGGQLVTFFQPVCEVATGRVVGMEALVRWRHPSEGLLGPGDFIGLAEDAGLMRRLTNVVLDQSLAECRRWHRQGFDTYVAVNLSPSDLLDSELPLRIETLLRRHRLRGRHLLVEITEDTLMSDAARGRDTLHALRALGVRTAIDDFGTGYSSLSYLRDLPVDMLKLDRLFVAGMLDDRHLAAIVESTIGLAHSLDLSLTAEGVEHQEVADRLTALGADLLQGWHLGRPMPAEEVVGFLDDHASTPRSRASVR